MHTLSRRLQLVLTLMAALFAQQARAEDTRPPVISEVNASKKGSQITVTAKITDETGVLQAEVHYRPQGGGSEDKAPLTSKGDDKFTATFTPSGAIEYQVWAVDELGNGPAKYPSASSWEAVGKKSDGAVASNKAPRRHRGKHRKAEAAAETPADSGAAAKTDEAKPAEETAAAEEKKGPPTVEHEKPTDAKEGEALALKVKITGNTITQAVTWFRKQGQAKFTTKIPLEKKDGDDYEGTIPAGVAKGTIEYVFIVADDKGQKTTQGDGGPGKAFQVTFGKASAAVAGGASGGPFTFAHKAAVRASPGINMNIRVQATPEAEDGAPDKAMLLYRGKDGGDQVVDLAADESGGIGGFSGQIPAPADGALYYQIVACKGDKCGVDTGSKKSWHAVAVSNDGDAKAPDAIDAVSSKAPASLPE